MCDTKVDDFIGRRFGKNNQVTVVTKGVVSGEYIVQCSECAKDPELFGDGTFRVRKFDLINRSTGCGCAKRVVWTERQQRVRIARVCIDKNIEFISFVGEYKGVQSRLNIRCLVDGNTWEVSVSNFISGGIGCPKCAAKAVGTRSTKQDSIMIDSFKATGAFIDGTTFWRSARRGTNGLGGYWKYTCPVCSNDEYVRAGVCSGVFEAKFCSLQRGAHACRCTKLYRWTKQQREYQVNKIIRDEGLNYRFIGFVSSSSTNRSRIKILCEDHGEEFTPTIASFVGGTRCPSCAATGYDPNKAGTLYILKISNKGSLGFTGFGVSNVITDRLKTHRKTFSDNGCTLLEFKLFVGSGREVVDMESFIKDNFECCGQNLDGFRREATHFDRYEDVVATALTTLQEVKGHANL